MEILVRRETPADFFVMGVMYVNGKKFCDTLEDPPRETKVPAKTGIPVGRYEISMTYSNRFKKVMPLVVNVPGFSGIRIHGGRNENDTEGCILVGYRASLGVLGGGPPVSAVLSEIISKVIASEKVFITIE